MSFLQQKKTKNKSYFFKKTLIVCTPSEQKCRFYLTKYSFHQLHAGRFPVGPSHEHWQRTVASTHFIKKSTFPSCRIRSIWYENNPTSTSSIMIIEMPQKRVHVFVRVRVNKTKLCCVTIHSFVHMVRAHVHTATVSFYVQTCGSSITSGLGQHVHVQFEETCACFNLYHDRPTFNFIHHPQYFPDFRFPRGPLELLV